MRIALLLLTAVCVHAATAQRASAEALSVDTIPCSTPVSLPFLVQADRDPEPEWAVLSGTTLLVSDIGPNTADTRIDLPEGTTAFDLRDADRDGTPDLAAVRGSSFHYWADATGAVAGAPALRISDERFAALSFGGPRPTPLFFRKRGDVYLSAPFAREPRIWDLSGAPAPAEADERAPEPELIFAQSWDAAPNAEGRSGGREFQITQRFEPARDTSLDASGPPAPSMQAARDASSFPVDRWPWFPVSTADPGVWRAVYALSPPDFQDTMVLAVGPRSQPEARISPKHMPGRILLSPHGSGDVNGDGYADLVTWRLARPAPSLDMLSQAARAGTVEVVVAMNIFEPASGRFTGRPSVWFRSDAPVITALGAGVMGPFAHVRFEDADGDGRDDLITSGRGDEVLVWSFAGREERAPRFRAALGEPMTSVAFSMRPSAESWLMVAETPSAFHLLSLTKQ